MKILVVMGSPRKGESYSVMKKVEAHMQAQGDVTFDYLWLKDVNFGQCSGCHACIRFGEEKCPLRDDRAMVEARMMAADGLILVTPVYAQQVSYLMKIYFDHLAYAWHRPRFFGKFAMVISAGGAQAKSTLDYMKENTTCWGYTFVCGLGAQHPDALVPKMRQKLEREIEKKARQFFNTVKAGRTPAPSLYQLIWFRMWRLTARACKDFTPADYTYWTAKGWFEKDYYTGQPVGTPKRIFASAMEKILQSFMRSVYMGY